MKKTFATLLPALLLFTGCTYNPLSGKKQMTLLPEADLQKLSGTEYRTFLTNNRVVAVSSNNNAKQVQRVGTRIINAVKKYYADRGIADKLNGYEWEVNLVDDNTVNAWCMPGGKIVVYTGLLSITQNEAALATVMGHEVSHALLLHGNQRMSQGILQQLGNVAIEVAMIDKPKETKDAFLYAYGVSTQLGVLLPFSRKHELEADRYGLIFTAVAGYDPTEAIPLWERMEKASGGNSTPAFLSTHPSEGKRIEQIKKYLPEALMYYAEKK